ncbi:MAG TPA: LTA synthase family protein [Oscillospiraceae bacterium]|nr:LTA synthase family protein [Oscillospiraceae bacterium]
MTALCLLALAFFSRPLRLRFRRSLPAAVLSMAALALAFGVFADRLIYTPLGLPLSGLYGQTHVDDLCGVPLGIWRDALSRMKTASLYDYSEESMQDTLSAAEDYAAAAGSGAAAGAEEPNIILVLSESFFDVTTLPGVSYEGDPLENFHRLQAEGVSGAFHTRSLGYGTCNIELEILTGLNTALFPESTDLCYLGGDELSLLDPIPALLRENGYYTAMLHTFNDSIYNRTPIMTAIGFDDLFFSGDFAAVDDEAAAAADYWDYMDGKISGMFYSDDYLADLLIDLYEKKTADAPVFLYGVSMENHSPYNDEKYGGVYDYPADAPALDTEALAALNSATQGISDADRALGKLTDYFADCDEPTVIIFFGDHRPGLGLSSGGSVYDALGMPAAGTLERYGTLYETSYLIWSNDPSLLPDTPGSTEDESSDYLGLQILDAAHIPDTVYWGLVRSLSEESLIYTPEYYISASGTLSAAPAWESGEEDRFSRMGDIIYDAFYGKQYITQALGAPAAG